MNSPPLKSLPAKEQCNPFLGRGNTFKVTHREKDHSFSKYAKFSEKLTFLPP